MHDDQDMWEEEGWATLIDLSLNYLGATQLWTCDCHFHQLLQEYFFSFALFFSEIPTYILCANMILR